ncbi:MAG: ImmA/IrrE family metallo-endopeptidase [Hyphomicrobiales bacterium]|nr:MAG: ImmA/IrrE family metallo-endopeptidase [Hyphomicrobiales bacterium]
MRDLAIVFVHLPRGVRGEYRHDERTIALSIQLSRRQAHSTLAHELGHAYYGHLPTDDPVEHAKQERMADDYAAQLLITPAEYADAEQQCGTHLASLAYHLDVTPAIVRAWRSLWMRRGTNHGHNKAVRHR